MTSEEVKESIDIEEIINKDHSFGRSFVNPKTVNGGWIPIDVFALTKWLQSTANKSSERKVNNFSKPLKELIYYVDTNGILNENFNKMIQEAINVYGELFSSKILVDNEKSFWKMVDFIINQAPKYRGLLLGQTYHLFGVPLAAFFTIYDAMPSGLKLFSDTGFNNKLDKLLNEWGKFLSSDKSSSVLNDSDEGWFGKPAMKQFKLVGYDFNKDFIKQLDKPPYWKSWNDFFTRDINREVRPIGKGIVSCNDGYLFKFSNNVKMTDEFWLKDSMPYSLNQIFGPNLHNYAKKFKKGSIFQTFLSPFSFHRWWSPVSGKIVKVLVIKGCYYKKLIVPDLGGTTTSSLPYLLHINTRGICIIDTNYENCDNIGLVAAIPIGMCEVSSIKFINKDGKQVKEGDMIKKGEQIGWFQFGGSSFAIIFENLTKYNKKLKLCKKFNVDPVPLPNPNGTGGIAINVGETFATIEKV